MKTAMLLSVMGLLVALLLPVPMQAQKPASTPQSYRGANDESRYAGSFSDIAQAIDAFWASAFSDARIAYGSPEIVLLDRVLDTACGTRGPDWEAFYCQPDRTIYLDPGFLAAHDQQLGDYAPIIVLAQEWGHHVQHLLRIVDPGGNTYELQADCLAGALTLDAEQRGLLEQGDLVEAIQMSESAGDPVWFPQDQPGAHGTYADRIRAVLRGYLDGLAGCDLAQFSETIPVGPTPLPTSPPLPPTTPWPTRSPLLTPTPNPVHRDIALPTALPLAHAACFRIESEDILTFDELVARFGDTDDARSQLQAWGWQTSASRIFACDAPPDGEAGWIDISVHRFATPLAAQQAVDYFAAARADGASLSIGASPAIGDYAAALAGPATNGKEFTLYTSQGPVLVRVTGVSRTGIPFGNVLAVARAVLSLQLDGPRD